MQNGQIVQTGTHDSLMNDIKGVYYELVCAQQMMQTNAEETDDTIAELDENNLSEKGRFLK